MDKNLHNLDDVFKGANLQYEEDPSSATWEKLNALLDKQDADSYKKRFIGWKRIAMLLLLLLSGLIIYESGIITKRKAEQGSTEKDNSKDPVTVKNRNFEPGTANHNNQKQNQTKQNADTNALEQEMPERNSTINSIETERKEIKITAYKEDPILLEPPANKFSLARKKGIYWQKNGVSGEKRSANAKNKLNESSLYSDNLVTGVNSNERPAQRELNTTIEKISLATKPPNISMIKTRLLPDSLSVKSFAPKRKRNAVNNFKPYWIVSAFASNDWGWYQLDNDVSNNNGTVQDEKQEINSREKHEASFAAAVLAIRQFSKHLGIKTGLIFSNTAITIDPHEMYASQQPNGKIAYKYITSSGYGYVNPDFGLPPVIGDSIQSATAQHNLQSIGIPLMLTGKFDKNRFSVMPAMGMTVNFITRSSIKTEVLDALNREYVTINGLSGMRKFYTGFIVDLTLQYNYNNRWSFNVLPTFKYALTPVTRNNVVKTYPYSFGVGAGVTYKL